MDMVVSKRPPDLSSEPVDYDNARSWAEQAAAVIVVLTSAAINLFPAESVGKTETFTPEFAPRIQDDHGLERRKGVTS